MYEERRNRFSLRDIILIILLMILFIFVMVWLFPTKGYLEQNNVIVDNKIYNDYLDNMTTVAKDYFINSNMPSNVGDTVKLTLSDMLEKKLIVEIGGKTSCDLNKSFIEVTKLDEDFQLRVELSCTDYYDYKIVTLGCKDYCNLCNTTVTDTKVDNTTKPTTTPTQQSTKKYTVTFDSNGGSSVSSQKVESGKTATKPANPTKEGYTFVEWTLNNKTYNFSSPVTSNITLVASWKANVVEEVVKYEYLYTKTTTVSNSNWSDWSTTQRVWNNFNFTNTDTKEYKIVKEGSEDSISSGIVDTKTAVTTKTEKQKSSLISYIESKQQWVYEGLEYSKTPIRKTTTDTTKYEKTGIETVSSECDGCSDITYYVYKKYVLKDVDVTMYKCESTGKTSTDSDMECYKNVTVKITPTCSSYGSSYQLVDGKCVKYGNVTTTKKYYDYQYRTLSVSTSETTDEKYSSSNNDTSLINQGYKLTKTCTITNGNRTCK